MRRVMPVETWYVISVLLAPIGYVLQNVVVGAMTVEVVLRVDDAGQPFDDQYIRLIHTTMQTLGRVAIIGVSLAVSLVKIVSKQQNVAAQMDARWGFLLVFPSGWIMECVGHQEGGKTNERLDSSLRHVPIPGRDAPCLVHHRIISLLAHNPHLNQAVVF